MRKTTITALLLLASTCGLWFCAIHDEVDEVHHGHAPRLVPLQERAPEADVRSPTSDDRELGGGATAETGGTRQEDGRSGDSENARVRDGIPVELAQHRDTPAQVIVLDEAGQPISGASIEARPARPLTGKESGTVGPTRVLAGTVRTRTGADGRAELKGLPDDDHREVLVRASVVGRPSAIATATAGALRSGGLTLRLEVGGAIAGVVVDGGGSPRADVELLLMAETPSADPRSADPTLISTAEGRFEFTGLPTGLFTLYANGGERGRARVSGLEPQRDITAMHRIVLAPLGTNAADEAAPPRARMVIRALAAKAPAGTGSIVGTLSSLDPPANGAIALVPDGDPDAEAVRVDRQSGRRREFTLRAVPTGTWELRFLVDGEVRGRRGGVVVEEGRETQVLLDVDAE